MRTLILLAALLAATPALAAPKVTRLTPPSAFHGVHGIRFSPKGELYAGSVAGQSLYLVNTANGTARTLVGPPQGMADDISFGPGEQVVWTAISDGVVYTRRGKGPVEVLAKDIASINSIAFSRDGKRLFAAQVFGGDALWELDPAGHRPPRRIIADMGGFNSFSPGPDGWLYGPLWFKGQVVRINPDSGELKVVAEGLGVPAAAHFDSKDNLYAIDTSTGTLLRIDIATGAKTKVAQLETALDNFAIDAADRIVVSNMADNGLQWVDPKTGKARQIMKGALAFPADIAVFAENGRETVYVADVFAYRAIDGATGKIRDIARVHTAGASLEYPTGATAYADKVVLASSPTGEVQVFDRASGARLSAVGGFNQPSDAVLLEDGTLLVAELGTGNLVRSGEEKKVLVSGLATPASLAAGPRGTVYVAEVTGGRITRADPANGSKVTIASGLAQPKAVAVAPDGSLVVLEMGKKRVVRIDPGDGRVTVIAANLPVGLVAEPFPLAGGVAVGPSGTIYVTSDVENAIYKIVP